MLLEFSHVPIMRNACVTQLACKSGSRVVDGTLGGGGHAEAILEGSLPEGMVLGLDKDLTAIKAASERLKPYGTRFTAIHSDFCKVKDALQQIGWQNIDGALLDLGVSSYQLDTPQRGFSYQADAPLDMRMDETQSFCAFDVVNNYDEQALRRVITAYGEERWAARIAQFIVQARASRAIYTTGQLVEIIKNAIPAQARKDGPHPAKRTYQAIRIEVNGELESLEKAIADFVDVLRVGARLCIITFHSLEDRIVKQSFNRLQNPCICPPKAPICVCGKKPTLKVITRKPIYPSQQEIDENPRARSAKLRVAEKI